MRVCSCVDRTRSEVGAALRNAETRLCTSAQTSAIVVDDASASPWLRSFRPLVTGALGGSDASLDISFQMSPFSEVNPWKSERKENM